MDRYLEEFFSHFAARSSGYAFSSGVAFQVYRNPSSTEWRNYIPEYSRALMTESGDLYVAGFEDLTNAGNVLHEDIFQAMVEKDPTFEAKKRLLSREFTHKVAVDPPYVSIEIVGDREGDFNTLLEKKMPYTRISFSQGLPR